jgi:hypothetical protein
VGVGVADAWQTRPARNSDDLARAVGEPRTLFTASSAPWVRQTSWDCKDGTRKQGLVTDGPYLVRSQGRLLLLGSSFGVDGYVMGIAHSESGTLHGPWQQQAAPLYAKDGGHGMIFRMFDGRLMRFCRIHEIQPYWLTMWALFPGTLDGVNCLLWPKSCPTMAHPIPLVYDRARGKAASIDYESGFVWIEDWGSAWDSGFARPRRRDNDTNGVWNQSRH